MKNRRGGTFASILLVWTLVATAASAWWPFHKKEEAPSGEPKKSFWSSDKGKPGTKKSAGGEAAPATARSEAVAGLLYNDEARGYVRELPVLWGLHVNVPIAGQVWIGTTYKEVPYTKDEYEGLREKLIQNELDVLKREYVRRKKEAGGENQEKVGELLDQFLSGQEVKDDKPKEKELAQPDKKLLAGFDEDEARKNIVARLIVPQSRAVETQAAYFQLSNSDLYCVELRTGITVWILRLSALIEDVPHETKRAVEFVADGRLFVIDKQAGLVLHRSLLDSAVLPVPFATGESYFIATYRRHIMNWDPEKNFPLWNKLMSGEVAGGLYGNDESLLVAQENGELTALGFDGQVKWAFISKGVAEDKLYLERELRDLVGEITKEQNDAKKEEREVDKNKVRKLELQARELEKQIDLLELRVRGSFLAPPVTRGESIYVGSTDFNLYKLNRYTGIPEWQYTCKSKIVEAPFVGEKRVWQRDLTGTVHAVDIKSGAKLEELEGVGRIISASDDIVYFVDTAGRFRTKTRLGLSAVEGLMERNVRVADDAHVLVAFSKASTEIHAYDLTQLRR